MDDRIHFIFVVEKDPIVKFCIALGPWLGSVVMLTILNQSHARPKSIYREDYGSTNTENNIHDKFSLIFFNFNYKSKLSRRIANIS